MARFRKKKPAIEMWCAQSFGLGISAGDLMHVSSELADRDVQTHQQYVNGILSLSIMVGLDIKLMGSRFS